MLHFIKRAALCALMLLACNRQAMAQFPASAYSFSSAAGTFTPLSGGTALTFSSLDDGTVQDVPIGFTFEFCGVPYTEVSICTNGWISFGNVSLTSTSNSTGSAIYPAIMPLWDDISGQSGVVSHLTSGTPGSQVFTVEWLNWTWYYKNTTPIPIVISFQAKLYEATGRIEYVYRQEADPINGSPSATIGIMKSSTDYQTLSNSTATPTASSTTFTTSINTKPANGQLYRWDPPPPCPGILPITVSNYNSTAVDFGWGTATGAVGYEWAVDTNPDKGPAGTTTINTATTTTASQAGLTPATRYYIHVRSKCSAVSYSKWDTASFETRPDCAKPGRIMVGYIDSNSVSFQWPAIPVAVSYEYLVDQTRGTPAVGAAAIGQSGTAVSLTGLTEGALYYVHYRSLCAGDDSSAWALDSFRIPVPCRRPVLKLVELGPNNSIISWDPVYTATAYEYLVSTADTTPAYGTRLLQNALQTPFLTSATTYNVFVRCNCEYYNVDTKSAWAQLKFTTPFATGISNVPGSEAALAVYPNPTSGYINVSIPGTVNKGNITIADMTGKVLLTATAETNTISLNIGHLPAGSYMLNYTEGDKTISVKVSKQ